MPIQITMHIRGFKLAGHQTRTAVLLAACAAGSMATGAIAREPHQPPAPTNAPASTPPPTTTPPASPTDPNEVDRLTRELQSAVNRRQPVAPTAEPRLTPASPETGRGSTRLLREGTILVSRRGLVTANDRGELVIAFEAEAGQSGVTGANASPRFEPPMVLLPSQSAAQVARLREREGGTATVLVSGQVTSYHGRNYLLLTRPAEVVRPVAPPPPASPAPSTADSTNTKPAGDPDRLMADLEQAAVAAAASAPGGGAERLPGGADEAPTNGAREGSFVTSRRGRMVRSSAGAWSLVFDTASGAKGDAPLELMPCVNLMAMEDLALRGGEGLSLLVSGPVYSQSGRAFLLPTLYVVQPRTTR